MVDGEEPAQEFEAVLLVLVVDRVGKQSMHLEDDADEGGEQGRVRLVLAHVRRLLAQQEHFINEAENVAVGLDKAKRVELTHRGSSLA